MAKAQFHKNQRVFVKPVGTWARIEKVAPQWTKGLDEPIRIFYDVGMGREFSAEELVAEMDGVGRTGEDDDWRITRARNKWQSDEECADHPYPGTYPVIMTSENDWGGWRVPGAEYALSPTRVEHQARLMVSAPHMMSVLTTLNEWVKVAGGGVPDELLKASRLARHILGYVNEEPG